MDWSQAEEWKLRYDFFLGDIEFVASDHDLSARWGWIPVLDFALSLDSIVDSLAIDPEEPCVYSFTESGATISFTRCDEFVDIEASYVPGVVRVNYSEMRGAAKRFLGEVIGDAVSHHPELAANPHIVEVYGNLPTVD